MSADSEKVKCSFINTHACMTKACAGNHAATTLLLSALILSVCLNRHHTR